MYNFFVNEKFNENTYKIKGNDYNHIKNVLRMKIGEQFLVSNGKNGDLCVIEEILEDCITAKIVERDFLNTNLSIEIYLFQGIPKQDKMELIIQKSVELGVNKIIPVEMHRSIVRIEEKKKADKLLRWQAIAESAGKQSKRTLIPSVCPVSSFKQAIDLAKTLDLVVLPYENQKVTESTKEFLKEVKSGMKIGVIIGPEGGFEENEVQYALNNGVKTISLGKRILRTETAAITTLSMLMLYSEMYL